MGKHKPRSQRSLPLPPPPKPKWYEDKSTEVIFAIILLLFPAGWSMLGLPYGPYIGAGCWVVCAALLCHVFIFRTEWKPALRACSTVLVILAFGTIIVWALKRERQPDVTFRLVSPIKPPVVVLYAKNETGVMAKGLRYEVVFFNLDPVPGVHPYYSSLHHDKGEWVGPYQELQTEPAFSSPGFFVGRKKGDRLIGVASITCPECKTTHGYWIYIIAEKEGWYAETSDGSIPKPEFLIKSIPQIKDNPEQFFQSLPLMARKNIEAP